MIDIQNHIRNRFDVEHVFCRFCDGKGFVHFLDKNEDRRCRHCAGRGQWFRPIMPQTIGWIGDLNKETEHADG